MFLLLLEVRGTGMSGPRVWVDENDLRVVLAIATLLRRPDMPLSEGMSDALARLAAQLDPPPPPPLGPYRACMHGHGA